MIFDSFRALVHALGVGALSYFAIVILLRISGKRTLAKWNAFDFIVTIAFGSILASGILNTNQPLVRILAAYGLLIGLQFMVTWTSVRWRVVEDLVKSSPALLAYRGELQRKEMLVERVSEEEVRAAMRSHGVADLANVEALVLETDGSFSLIERQVVEDRFALIGLDRARQSDRGADG